MPEYALYRLKVMTLTPLHFGNGRTLLHRYDYAIHQGNTWRIREAALLDEKFEGDDPRLAEQLARTPPADLLEPEDYQKESPLFRYVIHGTPRAAGEGAELQEQLKDPFDRPYFPGTELKGALRTALAWHAWQEKGLRPDVSRLGNSPRSAASGYERTLFGPDPNHDLFRALHISDSEPVGTDRLMLLNVRVVNADGTAGAPVEVEAVRSDTTFEMTMKLDRALYSDWAKRYGLHLSGTEWLEKLAEILRRYSAERIERESAWAARLEAAGRVPAAYKQLKEARLAANHFLLQVGWGTGWESKTFGALLKENEAFMRTLLKPVNQRGYGVARGRPPQNVLDFPTSRRLAMAHQRDPQGRVIGEAPAAPLGWVLVAIESEGRI